MVQSMVHPINQSTNEPINQFTKQSINQSINQYHSWFYYKPPPYSFEMLKYLKKEE